MASSVTRGVGVALALAVGCGGHSERQPGSEEPGGSSADSGGVPNATPTASGVGGGSTERGSGGGGRDEPGPAGGGGSSDGGRDGPGPAGGGGGGAGGESGGSTSMGGQLGSGGNGGTGNSGGTAARGGCGSSDDPRNCCGRDCTTLPYVDPEGVRCVEGECSYGDDACLPGFAHCSSDPNSGCEQDLSQASHCGDCSSVCADTTLLCASPPGESAECVEACPNDLTPCGNQCVDLESNSGHCGACGNRCSYPNGVAVCVEGECVPAGCYAGYADCYDRDSCETFLGTFDACGRCGDSCEAANATSYCNETQCVHECDSGFADCDPTSPDCETRLDDPANCGACGATCTDDLPFCSQGSCVSHCEAPFSEECQGSCVDLATDPSNCGACGAACHAYQACAAGLCTPTYLGTSVIETSEYSPLSLEMDTDGSFAISFGLAGSVDLDPGTGTDVHSSNGGQDAAVMKFDPEGSYLWARAVGGAENDWRGPIAIAPDGSIVQSLDYRGTVDFDTGQGEVSHTALGSAENVLLKLSADGSFVWARPFETTVDAVTERGPVTFDTENAVYAAGHYRGEVDLDPGAGTRIESSYELADFLVKLDEDGDLVWALPFSDCDIGIVDLAVDDGGVLWVGGAFRGDCDMDPGQGLVERTAASNSDTVILLLDAATGEYIDDHVESLDVYENVVSSAFGSDGSRYFGISSTSDNLAETTSFVLKTDSFAETQWLEPSQNTNSTNIALAQDNGVVAVGSGQRSAGPVSQGVFVLRRDQDGHPLWSIDLPGRNSRAHDVGCTDQGFVVVGTIGDYGIDLDPGPDTDYFDTPGMFISRYAF